MFLLILTYKLLSGSAVKEIVLAMLKSLLLLNKMLTEHFQGRQAEYRFVSGR